MRIHIALALAVGLTVGGTVAVLMQPAPPVRVVVPPTDWARLERERRYSMGCSFWPSDPCPPAPARRAPPVVIIDRSPLPAFPALPTYPPPVYCDSTLTTEPDLTGPLFSQRVTGMRTTCQ